MKNKLKIVKEEDTEKVIRARRLLLGVVIGLAFGFIIWGI